MFFRRWFRHAALNAGCALSCIVHMFIPPQWDHDPEDVEGFDRRTWWQYFREGWNTSTEECD
ncbi:MAG TPA: hypothetical protein VHI13_16765 [Candidatus Kapabacteria bacterium]|nr:hypothetical protein [Candidatus Kapabacteria bacterium]